MIWILILGGAKVNSAALMVAQGTNMMLQSVKRLPRSLNFLLEPIRVTSCSFSIWVWQLWVGEFTDLGGCY